MSQTHITQERAKASIHFQWNPANGEITAQFYSCTIIEALGVIEMARAAMVRSSSEKGASSLITLAPAGAIKSS